jgi:hypothetical protein
MRIRVQLFTLMPTWTRIRLPKIMRIRSDLDPDPQHCLELLGWLLFREFTRLVSYNINVL